LRPKKRSGKNGLVPHSWPSTHFLETSHGKNEAGT
jgi:hypothetical protein